MATTPIFRVTTYTVPVGAFTGKQYLLHLRHELAPHYFTMVQWGIDSSIDTPSGDVGVQVTGDPYGTGDLVVADGNWLILTRGTSTTCSAMVQVTVVECLRDQDGGGFRLRDVQVTALAAAGAPGVQSVVDTTTWQALGQVVPFAGYKGGGISSSTATSQTHIPTLGVRTTPSGIDTLTFQRLDPAGTQALAASITTYVVEWGHEWTVDRVNATGTNGGATLDNVAMYSTQALTQSVARANSWLWACGYTDAIGAGNCALGQVATLGDGVAQLASESVVAVGHAGTGGPPITRSIDVYVMQHARLATDWRFKAAAAGTGTQALTVDAAAGTESYLTTDAPLYVTATEGRLAYLQASVPSQLTSELGQVLLTTRPTASTTVTATMADPAPGLAWVGWLQAVDFTGLTVQQDALPTLRATTYRISGTAFSGTTLDVKLLRPLERDYFVMLLGSTPAVAAPAPADAYAWVAQDPFGTGDLAVSADASTLRLQRSTAVNPWLGEMVVVESLRGQQHAGFRLIDVRAVALAAFTDTGVQVVNASANAAWSALDRVVVFAGHRGGGMQPVGALLNTDIQGLGVAVVPTGTSGLQAMRYTSSATACKAATAWCYVVEFGNEWQVQQLLVQAAAGGPDVDATGEYANFYLSTAVDPSKTLVWGAFTAEFSSTDSCWLSPALHLGDGVAQLPAEQRVSVGLWQPNAYLGALYVLTHPDLTVGWVKQATTASGSLGVTVGGPVRSDGYWSASSATIGSRWGLAYTANSSGAATPDQVAAIIQPRFTAPTTLLALRDRTEATWAGWFQAIDTGGIFTSLGAVQVADTDADATSPVQYLILQDPQWDGAGSVLRTTSEGGRAAGTVEPDTGNLGTVVGLLEGTPVDDTELTFRMRGGAVGGSGGWLYRKATETLASDWKAMNALTTLWRQDGVSATQRLSGHDVAYSTQYRRLLVAVVQSVTEIRVHYKDTDTVARGGWSYVSIVTQNNADPANPYCGLGLCELPDGTLLLAYQQQDQVTLLYNLTIYSSSDGGLTWARVGARVLNKVPGSGGALGSCQGQHQLDASGDWVRCAFLKEDASGAGAAASFLQTVVSPDRGTSWVAVTALSTSTWKAPLGYPGSFPVAMVGVGDASGTFLLAYLPSLGSTTIAVALAARDDAWERNTDLNWDISSYATTARVKGLAFVRAPDRIWLFAWIEGTDASELVVKVLDPADPADSANWTEMGRISGFAGVMRYGPHALRGTWAGHRLVLSAGLHDPDVAAGADPVVAGHWMVQAGAYDPKPWDYSQEDTTYNDYFVSGHRLVSYQWQPCQGQPAGGGANSDALTLWTQTLTAGGTASWGKQTGMTFSAPVAADAAYHVLALGVPGAVSDRWGGAALRGWAWHLRLQATGQRVVPATAEDLGVRIRALKDAGVNGYDYTLRVGTTQVVVYDNAAGAALATIATTDLASECEVRIAQWDTQVWVAWRKVADGVLAQWTAQGPYTLTLGALAAQSIAIGALAPTGGGTGSVLIWSDFAISYRTDAGQRGDLTKPTDLMGTRLGREATLVANGLRVRWGGSGAADQDVFTGGLEYLRGYQNLSLDSPRFYWESADLTEQELVFKSHATSLLPRWQMNALLLVGTVDRTCTLQFGNTDTAAAWAAPAAEYDLDATLYEDLTVLSVDGSAVQVVAATGDTFAPRRGELVGCYLRFTTAGAATGITGKVVNDLGDAGTGRWLLLEGAVDLGSLGVMPGAKAAIYGDRMVFLGDDWNRYHYFRVVFPDLSGVAFSLGTWSGTHRLGAMVPGFWQRLDPPLDWTFTDAEQPNVTEYRSKGGAGWQYEEGTAQRTFKGTVVGDVQEARRELRELLRVHHGYSVRPVGLVLDSLHPSRDTLVYGRWAAGGQLDEAAWYKDAAGIWRTAGDADLLVTEET